MLAVDGGARHVRQALERPGVAVAEPQRRSPARALVVEHVAAGGEDPRAPHDAGGRDLLERRGHIAPAGRTAGRPGESEGGERRRHRRRGRPVAARELPCPVAEAGRRASTGR